jgi:hypothetical protein
MHALLPVLAWSALLGAPARSDDSLPADPDKAIEKVTKEVEEIQKRARKAVQERQKKLIAHLRARHAALLKKGKDKEATAVQDRIVLLEATLNTAAPIKTLAATLKKASVNGKYKRLLRVLHVPADGQNKADAFADYGMWNGTDYAGYTKLPAGYWVLVGPYWYIWGDLATP